MQRFFHSRFLICLRLSLLGILTACATHLTTPASTPARPEAIPITDPEIIFTPHAETTRQRMIAIAQQEWEKWGRQTQTIARDGTSCVTSSPLPATDQPEAHSDGFAEDNLLPVAPKCLKFPDGTGMEATSEGCVWTWRYWRIVGEEPSCQQITTAPWAWSAVFISWLMRQSGLNQDQFLTSESHARYVVDARDRILAQPAFTVIATPAAPVPGDIVCAVRSHSRHITAIKAVGTPMHCDLIVEVDPVAHMAKGIGGNVQQAVTLSLIELDADNTLPFVPGADRPWVLIMRNQLP